MYKIENGKIEFLETYKHKSIANYSSLPLNVLSADGWIDGQPPVKELTTEQIITNKIMQASEQCQQRILSGFDSDCLGVTKHFDAELTDQATIQGLTITALLGLNGLITEECHWKGTGELECYKFEYTQMLQLATDLKRHVESNINQFNAERLVILSENT